MIKLINDEIDGKRVTFFKSKEENAPIVYTNMFQGTGEEVLTECEKLGESPFHFVSISNLNWDEDLSPWESEKVVSKDDNFTGKANAHMAYITDKVIPYIEKNIKKPTYRMIAGYSMGGLFSLYAPYVTDVFSKVVSASGSVWYPDFVSYVKSHNFLKAPDSIYLSIGDLESNTKNKFLCKTEAYTKELYSIYQEKGIDSIFELNKGNHYKDAFHRLAKGIVWALR